MFWFHPPAPAFDFDVTSGGGLEVSIQGVPIVRGSWFQYYEPGWTKGYYSSTWQPQHVQRVDADTVEVTFSDGPAHGKELFHRSGDRLIEDLEYGWGGDHPVKVEVDAGALWGPAFESGTLIADGRPTRSLGATNYSSGAIDARRYSADATTYAFDAPLARVELKSSSPMTLFDARSGYPQDWADGKQAIWYGALGLDTARDAPAKLHLEWRFATHSALADHTETLKLAARPVADAQVPDTSMPVWAPYPKEKNLDFDHPMELTGGFSFPAGRGSNFSEFQEALARRFRLPQGSGAKVAFDCGISRLGFAPGGYRITITPKSVSVYGEQDEGVRYGLARLASLAFTRNGKLLLPTGTLADWPSNPWRGVHLFVGPQAREFHKRLWDRVLLPLGFNKVVLECERTNWNATPGIAGPLTMSKADLAGLFEDYRARDVEPIPLIQSFGHMDWLFENGKNLDIAMDPARPYAVDPRKPRTAEILTSLWKEAIDLLHPKTIHFGLDEVDMEGFPKDPVLTTELWEKQLAMLGEIARKHDVMPMLWGDICLAPGQAPDATNGVSPEIAKKRRDAVPRGAMIADWHYAALPKPDPFYTSLRIWQGEGFVPVAAAWYQPENVRSFCIAAAQLGAGTLQTTWAGYESSEERMIAESRQFTAMVLAADYSWSGRQEPIADLGYDPVDVFRRMYFGPPSPLSAQPGAALPGTGAQTIHTVRYRTFEPIRLVSAILPGRVDSPSRVDIQTAATCTEVDLALDSSIALNPGEVAGEVVIETDRGEVRRPLVYGTDFRSGKDPAACVRCERSPAGICSVQVALGGTRQVRGVSLVSSRPVAGLNLYGVTFAGGHEGPGHGEFPTLAQRHNEVVKRSIRSARPGGGR